jgi:hypothetical protein
VKADLDVGAKKAAVMEKKQEKRSLPFRRKRAPGI